MWGTQILFLWPTLLRANEHFTKLLEQLTMSPPKTQAEKILGNPANVFLTQTPWRLALMTLLSVCLVILKEQPALTDLRVAFYVAVATLVALDLPTMRTQGSHLQALGSPALALLLMSPTMYQYRNDLMSPSPRLGVCEVCLFAVMVGSSVKYWRAGTWESLEFDVLTATPAGEERRRRVVKPKSFPDLILERSLISTHEPQLCQPMQV